MDEMTQQNAALAEESAASAGSLTSQIQRLNDLVATFRTRQGQTSHASSPVAGRPATSEPDRLRQLAADAFSEAPRPSPKRPGAAKPAAKFSAPRPSGAASSPAPRRAAAGAGSGWEEF